MSSLLALSSGGTVSSGAGEKGRIHIDGLVFRDEAGAIWGWRGATSFLLYQLWLMGGAAAVDPTIADWMSLRNRPNVLRWLGMVNSFSRLHPQDWPEYYDELQPFQRHLWSRWQIRGECVIFADSGDIMPDAGDRERHAQRIVDALAGEPNVFIEVANEPSQHSNMPDGDEEAYALYLKVRRPGVMVATGAGDGQYAGDYVTVHTPRDGEPDWPWPRKARDLLDVRQIARVPCVADEPMGAAEVRINGKRDTAQTNFADYAAVAQQPSSLLLSGCRRRAKLSSSCVVKNTGTAAVTGRTRQVTLPQSAITAMTSRPGATRRSSRHTRGSHRCRRSAISRPRARAGKLISQARVEG